MFTNIYWMIIAAFIIAGLGEALLNPALNAAYLDITPEEHRSRAMGIKGAIGSLGSLLAPALVMIVIHFVPPQSVFLISAALILSTALLVFIALRLPSRAGAARDLVWAVSQERTIAAQSALHNVAVSAATARKLKSEARF
jgi:MFS family permease